MIPFNMIVISIAVHECKGKVKAIKNIIGVDISQLDPYDKVEMYLKDAQHLGLVAKC